ncbi:coiled-coil domain containing protein [Entamoeba marina]
MIIITCASSVNIEKVFERLELKQQHIKEELQKTKSAIPRFRLTHLLREIERKKTAATVYNDLQREIQQQQKSIHHLRKYLLDRKVCTNPDEQKRIDIMRDSLFRKNAKLDLLQHRSDDILQSIAEPSYVETLAEHLETKVGQLRAQLNTIRSQIVQAHSTVVLSREKMQEINTNIKKTSVGALKFFYEDERLDLANTLQKSLTKLRQLKAAAKDVLESISDERESFRRKIDGYEEKKYVEAIWLVKEARNQLHLQQKETKQMHDLLFDKLLNNKNLTDLDKGRILEKLRYLEMKNNRTTDDILQYEKRVVSLQKQREEVRDRRLKKATEKVQLALTSTKKDGKSKNSTNKARLREAKEQLLETQREMLRDHKIELKTQIRRVEILRNQLTILQKRKSRLSKVTTSPKSSSDIKLLEVTSKKIKSLTNVIVNEDAQLKNHIKKVKAIYEERNALVKYLRTDTINRLKQLRAKKLRIQKIVSKLISSAKRANKVQLKLATAKVRDINQTLKPLSILEKNLKAKLADFDDEIRLRRIEKYENEVVSRAKKLLLKKFKINEHLVDLKREVKQVEDKMQKEGKQDPKLLMERDNIYKNIQKSEEKLREVGQRSVRMAISMDEYLLSKQNAWKHRDTLLTKELKNTMKLRDTVVCSISRKFYDKSVERLKRIKKDNSLRINSLNRKYKYISNRLRNPNGSYVNNIIGNDSTTSNNCEVCTTLADYWIKNIASGKKGRVLTKKALNFCKGRKDERICLESYMKIAIEEFEKDIPPTGKAMCRKIGMCSKEW